MANRTLDELVKAAADLHHGRDGKTLAVHLTRVIWTEALAGDRFCIGLLWEALSDLPTQQDMKELTDELEADLRKIYGTSEEDELP